VKESKAMMKKEVAFMKKKGAPKSMIRHEEKEAGMKKGVKKMFGGGIGAMSGPGFRVPEGRPGAQSGAGGMGMRRMAKGGMAKGGMAKSGGSFRKAADGIASKGKTKGTMVKMAYGGKC